jgi:tetratricopeptide (TPR) repeat protein
MSARPISAADPAQDGVPSPPCPDAPPLPACLLADLLWESFTEEGAAAFADGRAAEALAAWRLADRLAVAFPAADPRRAAALANLAAVTEQAAADATADIVESLYRRALARWGAVPGWIERMTPERAARSSLFHHRMERKHRAVYQRVARDGHGRLAAGGRAACLGNLAGLLQRVGRTREAEALYREAIALRGPALGARDAGLLALLENLAALLIAEGRLDEAEPIRARADAIAANAPLTPRRRWASDKPVRMSDARRLLAAVYLTPIVRRG